MKTYVISYIYRGAENKFMSPFTIRLTANNKKEAREKAFYQIGDIYKIKNITEM